MKHIKISVPEFTEKKGMSIVWDDGTNIKCIIEDNSSVITANRQGLISLARIMLTLAQENVPSGYHLHLDASNSLEEGSCELLIGKD